MGTVLEVRKCLEDLIARDKKKLAETRERMKNVDLSSISDLKFDEIQISDAIVQNEKRLAALIKIEKNEPITPAEQKLLLTFEYMAEVANYTKVIEPPSKQKL